jgi:nicotinate-nucleotide--dimethylbenzimidazole phosphoribosyltransferase
LKKSIEWLNAPAAKLDVEVQRMAETRQTTLTKPSGSLGCLETAAVRLAAMQGNAKPELREIHITVFAGDHGIAEEGVSAFPQSVTVEMVRNFASDGAAICVAARELGAKLEVINMGTVTDPGPLNGVRNNQIGPGTANFIREPAMTEDQLADALAAGRDAVERAKLAGAQLFIGGEMGIANTTSATALACALLNARSVQLAGPGTGLDASGVVRKADVIQRALDHHRPYCHAPDEALRRLGGFEIAALAGSYVACAQLGITALVDGFISSVAALVAERLHEGAKDWFLFSHISAEPGHRLVLEAMNAKPLLDLGMRLGEGSGAAVAAPLLRMACALHNGMATFAEAKVSEKF